MFSFMDKVTTDTTSLVLFIWNVAPFVDVAAATETGRLEFGSAITWVVFNTWDMMQFLEHEKLSSISLLIKHAN